jgi:hypothetical protein
MFGVDCNNLYALGDMTFLEQETVNLTPQIWILRRRCIRACGLGDADGGCRVSTHGEVFDVSFCWWAPFQLAAGVGVFGIEVEEALMDVEEEIKRNEVTRKRCCWSSNFDGGVSISCCDVFM